MNEIVYIDVLLFENFLMNYLLLYILNRFCKCHASKWRILFSAFIGALYVIVIFFPDLHFLYSAVLKYMVSAVMIAVAFSPYRIKEFIKILILFYIEAFTIGGCIVAIFYLSNPGTEVLNGAMLNVPPVYIIIGCSVAIIMVKIGFDFFEGYYSLEKTKVEMQMVLMSKSCNVTALIDTGNSLKDPMTNLPVIVVYYKSIMSIFPDEIKDEILKSRSYDAVTQKIMNSSLKSRIRIIPYKALGVENGMLVGIRLDMLISRFRLKTRVIKDQVIALYNQPVSNVGDYQALTYPEIIKGEY